MSNAHNEQEGTPTSTTQSLEQALEGHHAHKEPDGQSVASSAAEEPSTTNTSSLGGSTPFEIAHRFLPTSATARQIVRRFLRNPTASYYKLVNNIYSDVELCEELFDLEVMEDDNAQGAKTLVHACFSNYANVAGPVHALKPSVITEQVGAESVLVTKVFDSRSRELITSTRATIEAITVLQTALTHGTGTSLAGPLCTLMTAQATGLRSLTRQPLIQRHAPPKKLVFHKESFQSSWRSQSSFEIWTSSGWYTTTRSHYIELTDPLLHKPDQGALWLFALTLRDTPFEVVHIYNCPISADTIAIGGGAFTVDGHEHVPNSQSGADEAELTEEAGSDASEPSFNEEDREWASTIASRFAALYGHEDYELDEEVTERALGQVLRWAQHLLAGSGSMTGAYKLMALTSYVKFSDHEEEDDELRNLHLNCFNATPEATVTECGAANPLVLWGYMNSMVALDPREEPLPLNTTTHGYGMMATMFALALRAHSELKLSHVGLDIFYTLTGLPSEPDSELRFHHQQLAQSSIDAVAPVLSETGVRVTVGDPDSRVCRLYSSIIGDYARARLCLSTNTLPLWLLSVLSGEAQIVPARGEVTVARQIAPAPTVGNGPQDLVTETTGRSVYMTWGPDFPRSPDLHTYINGEYGRPSILCSGLVKSDVYKRDEYEQTGTMLLVPQHHLYSSIVRTFASTPHDCTSECIAPLTHLRVPQGSVPVRERPPMMLGEATSLLSTAFRGGVDGSH